mgnify:CR=1 FL=1
MDEDEKVKKQLIKNMILNLITFSIIFYILGIVIYSQFKNSVYMSANSELEKAIHQINVRQSNLIDRPEPREDINIQREQREERNERSPRLVFIERNENGELIEDSIENNFLNDVFKNIQFDTNKLNTIYEIVVDNQYLYRGINYKTADNQYTQILINVDSEKTMIEKFTTILIVAIIISIVLIIIASYILSKNTLKPIIASLKKQKEFVEDASHELRTPLAIIKAKQETLLEKPNTKIIDNAEDINITLKETQRLTKLVKELTELARNDSNERHLYKESFYIDKEIQAIISPYKEVANSQNKNLTTDLQYSEKIFADINKIKELLIILLDNSIKYTEEKDNIAIKTYKKDNKCVIEVIDTGIGISKEARKACI